MENSYWVSSCIENRKDYPKFQGEREAEITIIGGGLTGLSTAYYLTKAGKKVILLENDLPDNYTK